uniref:Uncharacterized protein n=1 Tax=Populus trichocarpa TaxID=3694 RepID=A0A2K2C7V2_POPTR
MGPDRPVSAPVTLRAETRPTSNGSGLGPSSPPPQGLLQGRGATQIRSRVDSLGRVGIKESAGIMNSLAYVSLARGVCMTIQKTTVHQRSSWTLFQSLHQPAN